MILNTGFCGATAALPIPFLNYSEKTIKGLAILLTPIDPRIHFALVCASSSCPPIELYTPEDLEKELTIAAKTFLNSGGIRIDRIRNHVILSRIFKWYASDFGKAQAEIIKAIAQYIYDMKDRKFLEEKAEMVKVDYFDYDWRLNRYS